MWKTAHAFALLRADGKRHRQRKTNGREVCAGVILKRVQRGVKGTVIRLFSGFAGFGFVALGQQHGEFFAEPCVAFKPLR